MNRPNAGSGDPAYRGGVVGPVPSPGLAWGQAVESVWHQQGQRTPGSSRAHHENQETALYPLSKTPYSDFLSSRKRHDLVNTKP